MVKMTEAAFLVLMIVGFANGLKISEKCRDDGDCSKDVANSFCGKMSDCDTGVCMCVYDSYYKNDTTCIKATKMVAKGEICNPAKKGERCSGMPYVRCTRCAGGDSKEYKCRSTASGMYVATSVLFVVPIVYNLIV